MATLMAWCIVMLVARSPVNEPPQFWTAFANAPQISKGCRSYCVDQLFRRHVRVGMRVSELGQILNRPTWLKEEDVDTFAFLAGFIPVSMTSEDTVYVIRVFPELGSHMGAVYLRVSGKLDFRRSRHDWQQLVRGLRGDSVGVDGDRTVMEFYSCYGRY